MYDKSAGWYDAFYRDKDYEGEARRIAELVRQRHPAAMTLLDVACGTGRHLEYLAPTFRCTGVDLEARMLSVARPRVPEVSLVVGDMTTLDLGGQFDAVLCLFSSIGYVRTLDGLQRALAAMARQLAPGGVLVVEPWIRPETWRGGAVVVEVVALGSAGVSSAQVGGAQAVDERVVAVRRLRGELATRPECGVPRRRQQVVVDGGAGSSA